MFRLSNLDDLAGVNGFPTFVNLAAGVLIEAGLCLGVVTAVTVTDGVFQCVVIHHARVGGLQLCLGVLSAGIGVGGCCGFLIELYESRMSLMSFSQI